MMTLRLDNAIVWPLRAAVAVRKAQAPVKITYTREDFFFSSRRRHTRCLNDWSSDVCSSDLESALFDSLNIEENVAYPLLNQRSIQCPKADVLPRVKRTLEFVELSGTLEKFPSELSGGMRRRAAIARAVVTEPPLVLYDSPTAGLDPITAHTIIALLIKERDVKQTTTLLVTQRYQDGNLIANFRYNSKQGCIEPARNGAGRAMPTTFMVLREGRLIFEGSQDELEESKDSYISKFVKQRV